MLWRWGRIYSFRVDNGSPFGDPTRKGFSVLHLCLMAHGVYLKVNPPRRPTRNAKVERTQGTTARWCEPAKCKDYQQLQERLNQVVLDQREHYPTRVYGGKTRIEAFPQLLQKRSLFDPTDFDLNRVFQFIAKGKWIRTVSKRGSVSLLGYTYQLTASNKGKTVIAKFNVAQQAWDFFDKENGQLLIHRAIKGMTEDDLRMGVKPRK